MSGRRLDGRIAVVTGAGSGIGAATAQRLASEGAILVLGDINEAAVERVAREIADDGGQASAAFVDLAREDAIVALCDEVRGRHERLDILHNNAADTRAAQMARDQDIATMDPEVWDLAFTVNARGTMLMIKHALPLLIAAGGGSIINTSSGSGLAGDNVRIAYGTSKGAIVALTKYIAVQHGRQNVRCNAISPGVVLTEQMKTLPILVKTIMRHVVLPRLGEPDDIAALAAFLASDESGFITGQTICCDGGHLSHQPQLADMIDLEAGGRGDSPA